MFTYNIGFFTDTTTYKEERLINDTRFNSHNYQNILIKAHESVGIISDLSEKRLKILEFFQENHGFSQFIK